MKPLRHKAVLGLTVLFLTSTFVHGQTQERVVDSLWGVLSKAQTDSEKAECYAQFVYATHHYDADTTIFFTQEALTYFDLHFLQHAEDIQHMEFRHSFEKMHLYLAQSLQKKGLIKQAIFWNHRCLEILEQYHDSIGIAYLYNTLATLYIDQGEQDLALKYFDQSVDLMERFSKEGLAYNYKNIASIHLQNEEYNQALSAVRKSIQTLQYAASSFNYLPVYRTAGLAHLRLGSLDSAEYYLYVGLASMKGRRSGYHSGIYHTLAELHLAKGQTGMALGYADTALAIAGKSNFLKDQAAAHLILHELHNKLGNSAKALAHYKRYISTADSLANQELNMAIVQSNLEYEYQKKMIADSLERLNEEAFLTNSVDMQQAKLRSRNLRNIVLSAGLALLIGFAIWLFRSLKRRNQTHQRILSQKEVIDGQREALMTSIHYARDIQDTILPSHANLEAALGPICLVWQPRDLVSGDFYWHHETKTHQILACVDCTGHGIPGALMSLIGHRLLTEIVVDGGVHDPSAILDALHAGVNHALQQVEKGSTPDGMEMSLCAIPRGDGDVVFAGAKSDLYHIDEKGEFTLYNGSMKAIGGSYRSNSKRAKLKFENVRIPKSGLFFLATDGIVDQFGGPDNRKFGIQGLRNLLMENKNEDLHVLAETIGVRLHDWMGKREQLDDVLLIGFKG